MSSLQVSFSSRLEILVTSVSTGQQIKAEHEQPRKGAAAAAVMGSIMCPRKNIQ
jgi:hypothetical protein